MVCAWVCSFLWGGDGAASCVVSVEFVVSAAAATAAGDEDEPSAEGGEEHPDADCRAGVSTGARQAAHRGSARGCLVGRGRGWPHPIARSFLRRKAPLVVWGQPAQLPTWPMRHLTAIPPNLATVRPARHPPERTAGISLAHIGRHTAGTSPIADSASAPSTASDRVPHFIGMSSQPHLTAKGRRAPCRRRLHQRQHEL